MFRFLCLPASTRKPYTCNVVTRANRCPYMHEQIVQYRCHRCTCEQIAEYLRDQIGTYRSSAVITDRDRCHQHRPFRCECIVSSRAMLAADPNVIAKAAGVLQSSTRPKHVVQEKALRDVAATVRIRPARPLPMMPAAELLCGSEYLRHGRLSCGLSSVSVYCR